MLHNRLALHKDMVDTYLQTSREIWDAARTMTRAERHEAVNEIYAAAQINTVDRGREQGFYTVDEYGVAHIPIVGFLTHAASPCAALFGDAETEYGFIEQAIAEASADPNVKSIEFYVDSPGGYVDGVDQAAMAIADSGKPTVAKVHNMAASAAYWLASQADRIVASSPADVVGSIGVAVDLVDFTERDANDGIKHLTFTSTDAPDKRLDLLTDEGASKLVSELDDLHEVFAKRVANGRGVTVERVNKDFGRGGVVIADKALKVGMIDRVIDIAKPQKTDSAVVDGGEAYKPASAAGETMEVAGMDLNQLKTEHHDLYAQVFDSGREAGQKAEHARVTALQETAAADPDNEKLAELCAEAVSNGKTLAEIQPQVNVAIRDFKRDKDENPPTVATQQNETASGEKKPGESDTDAAIKAGVEEVLALYGEKEVARG